MRSIGFYVLVAGLMALLAFAAGQLVPGLGVLVVMLGSTMWAGYSARRGRGGSGT